MNHVTAIYRSIMLEVERRRHAVGFPMEKFSDYAGLPERYYPKALHADTPSGRQAQWGTLQVIIDALFPHGFDVTITPKPGQIMTEDSLKAKLLHLQAAKDPKSQRELMRALGTAGGKRSGESRRFEAQQRRRRKVSAQHAARMRWAGQKMARKSKRKDENGG